jgi:serine/threonine protein kinase
MQIYQKGECWEEKGHDLTFSYTKVILKHGDDFFYARTNLRLLSPIDVSELHAVPIPIEHIRPLYSADLTQAPTPLPDDTYVKVTNLLSGCSHSEHPPSAVVLAEARICETLRKHAHPNIGEYIGCITQDERITGLCFTKYDKTLADRLSDAEDLIEREVCLDIRRGIEHLHRLGITHNDINPYNIMFKSDGTAVLIDFDSCAHVGEKLLKGGGWADEAYSFASTTNDYTALQKIEDIIESQWTDAKAKCQEEKS